MTATLENQQMSDEQIDGYTSLIYDIAGIRISAQKRTMLSNRVRRRLKATGIVDFDEYLRKLKTLPVSNPEWDAFLQEVSTHETYLFRDEQQWDWFRDEFLSNVVKEVRSKRRERNLRIWSAACSTGDEAFTIATCIASTIRDHNDWKIRIIGTDIGVQAVRDARQAEFGERAMKLVPADLQRRYFNGPSEAKKWQAKPLLTNWTEFRQHNLLSRLDEQPFDIIFLKNVLIYFDKQTKKQAVEHIERALKPGALLVTAAAEGVASHLQLCDKVKPWLFQKQ